MAKYGTFKYKLARYGRYAVLRSPIQLKGRYRANKFIVNKIIQIQGAHAFRIKSMDGIYIKSQTIPINGQFTKFRIKPANGIYIICERKTLN
jgi:hypothetical protein